jgi:hypothetical protein
MHTYAKPATAQRGVAPARRPCSRRTGHTFVRLRAASQAPAAVSCKYGGPHAVSRHPHTQPLSTKTAQAAHAAPDERAAQLCAPAAASMGAPGAQRLGRHHCLWLLARLLARLDSELPSLPLLAKVEGPDPLYPTHFSGRLGVQGRAGGGVQLLLSGSPNSVWPGEAPAPARTAACRSNRQLSRRPSRTA